MLSRLRPNLSRWSANETATVDKAQTPPITASADRLQHIQRFPTASGKAGPDKPGQLVSNLTHYSPADSDARVASKTGKLRPLAYLASVSVDAAQHVIPTSMRT